jgi:polyphosphate kinase
MMEASLKPYKFKKLVVSPFMMRSFFNKLLNKEMKNAREGREAWAIIKMNSLVDDIIVRKLYKASEAGVKIKLIIRGICVLIPGLENWSKNIEGISIVDRFLEHARVMVFANGGKNLFYLTSADWMIRNFDNRVEVACPVEDKELQKELMDMLQIELSDNTKARVISSGDANRYKDGASEQIRSQIEFYKYLEQKLKN